MEEYDICPTNFNKRYKNKHQQYKKQKYFLSNLIINKYIVKNYEIDNFIDFFKSHYVIQKKKFDSFTVLIVCKMNGEVSDEIKLPSSLVMEKTYKLFIKNVDGKSGIRPCFEYIDDCFFKNSFCDEKNIIFISDFRDI